MTTYKPEVVAYLHESLVHRAVSLYHDSSCTSTLINTEPLIRLSDYENLQAGRDRQYDMKVKAREQRDAVTANLEALQAECEKLGERVKVLEDALRDQLNDCINFDGGKLTDCILEQSTAVLKGSSDE